MSFVLSQSYEPEMVAVSMDDICAFVQSLYFVYLYLLVCVFLLVSYVNGGGSRR